MNNTVAVVGTSITDSSLLVSNEVNHQLSQLRNTVSHGSEQLESIANRMESDVNSIRHDATKLMRNFNKMGEELGEDWSDTSETFRRIQEGPISNIRQNGEDLKRNAANMLPLVGAVLLLSIISLLVHYMPVFISWKVRALSFFSNSFDYTSSSTVWTSHTFILLWTWTFVWWVAVRVIRQRKRG